MGCGDSLRRSSAHVEGLRLRKALHQRHDQRDKYYGELQGYRVLCRLARNTDLKVPDYESYLLWKRGDVNRGGAVRTLSCGAHAVQGECGDASLAVVDIRKTIVQEDQRHTGSS
ncbi:hypothetical protein HPB50_014192 [Hyalomma asiaticum]|uniref:Uncharacterized protein n=1 Tax=Hyalomma asiaticum TaxID=266040 RepID=A0ACB7S976_HYAAI|nr:hypothetical protein HPB50_014192 [Hyalomma asiaticum]